VTIEMVGTVGSGYRMDDPLENEAQRIEESGDLESALRLWKELATTRKDPLLFCDYGRVAEKLGLWDEGERAFTTALRMDRNFPLALEGMGSLWFTRTDKSAAESFQTAKEWFLKALKYERNARLLTFLGATYAAAGNAHEAQSAFEEAIGIDPNYEEALYNLAKIEKDVDARKAIDLLERAIAVDPDYSLAHQELGKLYQHAGDLTNAEYHFRRSIDGDPTDYWSHLFLANLFAAQGKNIEAERMYKFATGVHPEIRAGVEFFARFLASIGKQDEAASVRAGQVARPFNR
jgi:tetratricopeptide (TPR) repeat protein